MKLNCIVPLLLAVFAAPGALAQSGLTAAELEALSKGELVARPLHVRRGSLDLIGGSSWQRVDAPIDVVWRALHDVEQYPNLLPNVSASRRVLDASGDLSLIFVEHGFWPIHSSYYVWLESDSRTWRIDFQLELRRPHSLKAGWGSVQLVARDAGHTIIAWSALVDVGRGVLAALSQTLIQPWMLRVPSTIKRCVERSRACR